MVIAHIFLQFYCTTHQLDVVYTVKFIISHYQLDNPQLTLSLYLKKSR